MDLIVAIFETVWAHSVGNVTMVDVSHLAELDATLLSISALNGI